MNTLLLTTDWHFGHRRMVELCGRPEDFESRIKFHLLEKLDKLKNQGKMVTLVHLGDVAFGKDGLQSAVNFVQSDLPDIERWLTMGNHDSKSRAWFLRNGWHRVARRFFNGAVSFTHCPAPEERVINIHGHQHTWTPAPDPNNILISLEHCDYRPITAEQVLRIKGTPAWDGCCFTELICR